VFVAVFTAVLLGATYVLVDVLTGVWVGGTVVLVGGTVVFVGGMGVFVGGTFVLVAGTLVGVLLVQAPLLNCEGERAAPGEAAAGCQSPPAVIASITVKSKNAKTRCVTVGRGCFTEVLLA
jgi:hypothetical protein